MFAKCKQWTVNRSATVDFKILRYTKTQIICQHPHMAKQVRFRKSDGFQVGNGIWKITNLDEVMEEAAKS